MSIPVTAPRTDRIARFELGRPWPGVDPFLFVAFHHDRYPAGDDRMAPTADVSARPRDNDVAGEDGWSMYHGTDVPGFPAHPHRGFETITIVQRGTVDHADSAGATARYGEGDVQWLTAGRGVSHSEMFPLLHREGEGDNELVLYQIWFILAAPAKAADPAFTMLWNEQIPVVTTGGEGQGRVTARVIAGALEGEKAIAPPPSSWASDDSADVAIWLLELEPHASIDLPATLRADTRRVLYVHGDDAAAEVGGVALVAGWGGVQEDGDPITVSTADRPATVLVLQGAPIAEPVAMRGPFVMNTEDELHQAFADYRRTQFGGWPWPASDPVHPRDTGRFARHTDGRVERPDGG